MIKLCGCIGRSWPPLSVCVFGQIHYFNKKASLTKMIWLTLKCTLGKIFSRRLLKYLSYFSQWTGFNISCKLTSMQTICMKFRVLFSGKNKKKYQFSWFYAFFISKGNLFRLLLSSAEFAHRMVKVNTMAHYKPAHQYIYFLRHPSAE